MISAQKHYTLDVETPLFGSLPFTPGRPDPRPHPLGQFLPPIPAGVVRDWLTENVAPGAWVLDPFGTLPNLPVEAARAGYRVLVAVNNPLVRFLMEMAATPPTEDDLRVALGRPVRGP